MSGKLAGGEEAIMNNVILIGIDLGKHSFHIHCQDTQGNTLLRKKLIRSKLTDFLSTCPSALVVRAS